MNCKGPKNRAGCCTGQSNSSLFLSLSSTLDFQMFSLVQVRSSLGSGKQKITGFPCNFAFAPRFVSVFGKKRAAPAAKQGQGKQVIACKSCGVLVAKFNLLNKHQQFDLTNAKCCRLDFTQSPCCRYSAALMGILLLIYNEGSFLLDVNNADVASACLGLENF